MTTTFTSLWQFRDNKSKESDVRGIWVRQNYFAYYVEELDCFDILFFRPYGPTRHPPLVAQLYSDGKIWFKPVESLEFMRKHTPESHLFTVLTGGHIEICRNRRQRGVRLFNHTGEEICITSGEVLLDSKHNLLKADPPLLPVKDVVLIQQYDALAKEVRTNTKLRTKISQLAADIKPNRNRNETTYLDSGKEFYEVVKRVSPTDLNTFRQLVIWAKWGNFLLETPIEDRLDKMFSYRRQQVLEHLGAVKYA